MWWNKIGDLPHVKTALFNEHGKKENEYKKKVVVAVGPLKTSLKNPHGRAN